MVISSLFASCRQSDKLYFNIVDDAISTPFMALPDSSVCMDELKEHFAAHPDRWQTAFKFLSELDVNNLPMGRTDLSEDVYVNVSEYATKEPTQCSSESHKQYIDVQYIVKGQEFMGITRATDLAVIKDYDAIADYMLYDFHPTQFRLANPDVYFIFFPSDIHCPCVQVNPMENVTKVVLKIKY